MRARLSWLLVFLGVGVGCGGGVEIPDEVADVATTTDTSSTSDSLTPIDTATEDSGTLDTLVEDTGAFDTAMPMDTAVAMDTAVVVDTATDTVVVTDTSTCPAVTDNRYYVDPGAGSDTSGTGSTTCAFKTLTRAVAYLTGAFGSAIPAGTQILLRGTANAASGEAFPIRVPTNVIVKSATTTIQTVEVGAGANGFLFQTANSGLADLRVAGATTANVGVAAVSGSSSTTTTLTNVTITGMRMDGIYVEGGGLKIGAGVHVDNNGVSAIGYPRANGMHLVAGSVVVAVNTGEATTSFNQNYRAGIFVENNASVTVTGHPDITGFPSSTNPPAVASGTGTVTTNLNGGSGVFLTQDGTITTTNSIDGLVSWKNNANGLRIVTPSRVTLRNSVLVANGDNGVAIAQTNTGTPSAAGIDLGGDAFGRNILQTPSNGNAHAGICVGTFTAANTIRAKGNYFNGKNCTTTPAPVPLPIVNTGLATYAGAMDCGSVTGVDVAISRTSMGGLPTGITVDLDNCADVIYP